MGHGPVSQTIRRPRWRPPRQRPPDQRLRVGGSVVSHMRTMHQVVDCYGPCGAWGAASSRGTASEPVRRRRACAVLLATLAVTLLAAVCGSGWPSGSAADDVRVGVRLRLADGALCVGPAATGADRRRWRPGGRCACGSRRLPSDRTVVHVTSYWSGWSSMNGTRSRPRCSSSLWGPAIAARLRSAMAAALPLVISMAPVTASSAVMRALCTFMQMPK